MIFHQLWRALSFSAGMTWEILWALVLGFLISAVVQARVSKQRIEKLLPDASPRSLATAAALGVASSSCSYASVAIARTLFRKGANFTSAIAFELASTNLVVELGVVMAIVLGWQFTLGEFIGGPLMIAALALLFRAFLTSRLVDEARAEVAKGRLGAMEGHAEMNMTDVSHVFVMEWAAVLRDIAIGLVAAGALAAWVPDSWWRALFLTHHGDVAKVWGPVIAPFVAMLSFVCSIGNVPLAAVLWNGGISFGGVIAFVFADLVILPILDIYRRYYGFRVAAFLFVTLTISMIAAGLAVGYLFDGLGLVPHGRHAKVENASTAFTLGPTTWLDIAALAVSAALVWRFFASGGGPMLRMMEEPMGEHHHAQAH